MSHLPLLTALTSSIGQATNVLLELQVFSSPGSCSRELRLSQPRRQHGQLPATLPLPEPRSGIGLLGRRSFSARGLWVTAVAVVLALLAQSAPSPRGEPRRFVCCGVFLTTLGVSATGGALQLAFAGGHERPVLEALPLETLASSVLKLAAAWYANSALRLIAQVLCLLVLLGLLRLQSMHNGAAPSALQSWPAAPCLCMNCPGWKGLCH